MHSSIRSAFRDAREAGVLLLREQRQRLHATRWEIPAESLRVSLRLPDSRRGLGLAHASRERQEFRQEYPGFDDNSHGRIVSRRVQHLKWLTGRHRLIVGGWSKRSKELPTLAQNKIAKGRPPGAVSAF